MSKTDNEFAAKLLLMSADEVGQIPDFFKKSGIYRIVHLQNRYLLA